MESCSMHPLETGFLTKHKRPWLHPGQCVCQCPLVYVPEQYSRCRPEPRLVELLSPADRHLGRFLFVL